MFGNIQAQTWPEVFGYFAISIGAIGIAWAWAWASVNNTKTDPFWNTKISDEEDEARKRIIDKKEQMNEKWEERNAH